MKLHLFYPENDLALASGRASYTAPKQARRLSQAGQLLPLHYGEQGDLALTDSGIAGIDGLVKLPKNQLCDLDPDPWGWSAAVRSHYLRAGIDAERLPGDEQLEKWRMMSHRRTGAMVAERLRRMMPGLPLPEPAIEVRCADDLRDVAQQFGQAMLKAPWSCSGRGVASTEAMGVAQALRMGADAIRKQGSVMVEPLLDKALDFAKIYECEDGRCRCLGTSVFVTDGHGRYAGNLLATETERLARVGELYPGEQLACVAEALRVIIEQEIAPDYSGIVGVDMLVDKSGLLQPVVEINLRKTMGYVAIRLADRLLPPGSTGILRAVPLDREPLPPGSILLSPPTPYFAFIAGMG